MNKQIKELAEQTKGFVDLNQHVGGEKGCMVYTYDGLEKFAKLIIKECCAATEGQPRSEIRNSILNHFGLEVKDLRDE